MQLYFLKCFFFNSVRDIVENGLNPSCKGISIFPRKREIQLRTEKTTLTFLKLN